MNAILKFYTLADDNFDYMHRSGIMVLKQGHNPWISAVATGRGSGGPCPSNNCFCPHFGLFQMLFWNIT